ncbi:hypothetical protein, partial [uncultured Cetobacterium sp.]|uniref:hypothetical protein n=1 Tax=uncultured Cetobacterium sp. TaxID=527638 RepID=UPI0026064471
VYGNGKRKVPIKTELGIIENSISDTDEIIGTIRGIPIPNMSLNQYHKNGEKIVDFKGIGEEFYSKDKDTLMTYVGNGKTLINEKNIGWDGWETLDFNLEGIKFGLNYTMSYDYYRHFVFHIKRMTLQNYDRNLIIEGLDYENQNITAKRKNKIIIPKFNPIILVNKSNSSIKEKIKKIEDIVAGIYSQGIKIIDLGNIAFYYMNVEILKQNSNENPYISLNNSVYLETKSSVSNKIIKAELSFNRGKIERKLNMNIKNSTKNGGGESENIYIHLKLEEYKKFVDNGDKVEYNLKSNNNNELVFIVFNANNTPVPPVLPERKFKSKLVESITIISKLVNPIKGDIYFSERSPILKNEEISLINSNINYINQPQDGYDYNKTLALIGNIDKYNNSQGKHDFEIEDDRGNKISGVIGSSGGGSHWENLNIGGGNKISLFYKRDGNTYIKLDQWNYESSQGSLVVKHYTGSSNTVNQYYRLGFHLPKLDSFIYYDNSNSQIKKEEQIIKQLSLDSDIIDLGKLQLQNYNMEITKQKKGLLTDEIGLRIEFEESVTLIEEETKIPYPMKGILKLIDKKEPSMNLTFLTGKGKSANLFLELPKGLPKSKTYKIESSNSNPIIKIGRTKHFKNLILGITLNKNPLIKGSSTLRFMPSYLDENRINFNSIDYDKLEEISLKFPNPDGVILENIKGYGLLKSKADDEIFINGMSVGIVDKNENLNKKDILLKCGSIITIFFENGDLSLVLKRNGASLERSENLNIYIKRKNEKITEHMFKLEFPSIWFIIKEKIPMDFGNVFIGEKNNLAKGEILIETSKEIKGNISIEIKEKNIDLFSMLKGKLNAQIENYYVSKGSLDDEYIININGKLDIPKEVVLGQYKGSIEVIISIKR